MTPIHLSRIREVRLAKGMSQAALAELAGIRAATLANIETGKTKGVDFATLEAIADALEVDASYLLTHDRKAPKKGRTARG